ncbi:DUF881 domain-containing protein [Cellulomonas soli]|uniref:DUF881 domain-containing protein n=1 Tax=Cellulomonas soli TaxID=931535 RepID=UPI003F828DC7
MNDHPHRARRGVRRGTWAVAVVLALSGALFAANASLAHRSSTDRHPQDLRELALKEADRVTSLASQVDDLRAQVDALTAEANAAAGSPQTSPAPGYVVAGGAVPVRGAGIVVTLDDAPADALSNSGARPDDLVVHQQDMQTVMNALWAGGAEAMALMDQRVISTSAFWCSGNVLRLHGLAYSPPFTVSAIGDPERLLAALDKSVEVGIYLEYVDAYGLGWDVKEKDNLELPAFTGATDLTWATVPEGVEVMPGAEPATTTLNSPSEPTAAGTADAEPSDGSDGSDG